MRSLIDHIRQHLKSCTWWPLRPREGRPGVMGVSRARASRASEGFADAEGIHITFDGKPIVQWAEFQTQRFPGKEPDLGHDYLLSHLLYGGQSKIEWLNGFRDDCQKHEDMCALEVPDTFPEDWTGGQP